MQAIILAGGLGTRLRTVISDLPKPMAPIREKPFLAYLLDYLFVQGFREIVFAVHYKYEVIQNYFKDSYSSMAIKYVIEDELCGTGGAIQQALSHLPLKKDVFVLNGDTFLKLNYQKMYAQHQLNKSTLTITLRNVEDCQRYGSVILENNVVIGFQEKGVGKQGLINAGVYLLQSDLFATFAMPKKFSFEQDFLSIYLQQLKPQAFLSDDYFIDIGIPEDYALAQHALV